MLRRLLALWRRRNTPRVIDDGVAADATACCPRCLTALDRFDHVCPSCATPITAHAAIDPLGRVYAMGHLYRQVADGRPRLVTVLGAWLLWWPAALLPVAVAVLVVRFARGSSSLLTPHDPQAVHALETASTTAATGTAWLLGLIAGVCELVLLYRVTKHFIRARRGRADLAGEAL